MKRKPILILLTLLSAVIFLSPGCDQPAAPYRGELLDDLPHGYGIWTDPGGAYYAGYYKEGLRHGSGAWIHPNGASYLGEWFNDECFGYGTLILGDGSKYSGQWAANMRHGYGIYTWADGRTYQGQWSADQMHGWGIKRYPDGACYRGFWQSGLQHGPGKMAHRDGSVEKGLWEMGTLAAVAVESIALSPASAVLTQNGKSVTLQVALTPAGATNQAVTWESSHPGTARVENGVVTPVSPGKAVITATTVDGGFQAKCAITVNPKTIAVTGVQLNFQTLNLTAGEAARTLIASIVPANATNKVVTWSSNNPAVASVSAYGTVSPLAPGEAIITVTTLGGRWRANCRVIVSAPPPLPEPTPAPEPP